MANHLVMQLRILAFVACTSVFVRMPAAAAAAAADDDDPWMDYTVVYAVANQTVRLSCPLERSEPPRVTWEDFVYNIDHDPQRIFEATGNRWNLEAGHPNSDNFYVDVDGNFTLVIRDLKFDDTGTYRCTSRLNETRMLIKSYYLAVIGYPSCSGTSSLTAGQNASFSCQANYSGNFRPRLEWRRGQDEVLHSSDNDEIRIAKKVVDFETSDEDDGMTFTCRMTFGRVVKDCHVNLTVFYSVRDLVMDPLKDTFTVGEEIRCSANGNPTPDLSTRPDLNPGKTGVGWRSFTIPKSLDGKKTDVECIASNTIDGEMKSIAKTISVFIASGSFATDEPGKPNQVRSESASSSSGAIVGGIVVGIMILVIVVAAVFCLRLRKEKKPKKEENGGAKTTITTKDAPQQTNQREQQV